MRVSFIIPVYKVEKYLRQCVESITTQTYRDIEVILVDDGSPDDSPALCDDLADEDVRVNAIHKENGGLSDARNVGLKVATGDFVVFVDGDDFWLSENDLSELMSVVKQQPKADFLGYNCKYYYPDSKSFSPWAAYSDKLSTPVDKNTAMIELVKSGTFPMSACLKLMKREFLIKNELFFVKGQIAEDIPWFLNMLDTCDKCIFVNRYVYAYRQNVSGSITNVSGDKSFRSLLNIVETETDKVESRSFSKEAKEALYSFLAYELSILMTYSNIDRETYKRLKTYSWLTEYDINPKVKKVNICRRFLGMDFTVRLLKLYQNKRREKK